MAQVNIHPKTSELPVSSEPALATIAGGPPKRYSLAKLARGSSSRVLQLCLTSMIGFVLTPFVVRSLGAEQYGMWALAYGFIGYFSILDLGMSASVFTHMCYALGAGNEEECRQIYRTGMAIFGGSGLVALIVTLVLALGVAQFYHAHGSMLAAVILIAGVAASIGFPMRVPFGVLNAGSHFDITAGLFMLAAILRLIGTVAVLRAHYGVIALSAVSLTASVITGLIALILVKRKFPFIYILERPRLEKNMTGKLFKFAFPVLFGQLADRVRLQTDTLTVSFFLGLTAVAHYNIATTLAMYYVDGIAAIVGVLSSVLSMQKGANDTIGLRQSIFGGTRVGIVASGFILFGIIAWGQPFIARWMGRDFLDAYPILVVLAIAMFLDNSQSTSVNALYATMNQKSYAVLNVSEAAANLALSIVLAKPLGMMGVALGTLIPCMVVRIFIQPLVVQRRVGIPVTEYFRVSAATTARVLICLIAPAIATHMLVGPSYPSLILTGAVSLILFALPIWRFEFQMRGAQRAVQFMRGLGRGAVVEE